MESHSVTEEKLSALPQALSALYVVPRLILKLKK